MPEPAPGSVQGDRTAIIRAVTTPLNFLVLGILLIEGVIGSLALRMPIYQGPLVWTVILSIPVFMAVVVGLAVFRPEALTGNRPLQTETAHRLGSDLYFGLEGILQSLEPGERSQAWVTVIEILKNDDKADAAHRNFCIAVAERLEIMHGRKYLQTQNAKGPGIKKP